MATSVDPVLHDALTRAGAGASGLRLLVLHGSRARGDAHAASDWDFAYEAGGPAELRAVVAAIASREPTS